MNTISLETSGFRHILNGFWGKVTTKLDRTDLRIVVRDLQDYERFLKRELAVIDAIGTIDFTIVLNRVPGEDSGGTGGAWVASGARTRQLILA